jgi:hypothetical protein
MMTKRGARGRGETGSRAQLCHAPRSEWSYAVEHDANFHGQDHGGRGPTAAEIRKGRRTERSQ